MNASRSPGPASDYLRRGKRRLAILAAGLALVLSSLTLDVLTGPAQLSAGEVVAAILRPQSSPEVVRTIVWTLRLPTALMALAVGAVLGIAGAEMQTILNNPLASPYTLGVSAAASFGAAAVLVFGAGASGLSSTLLISAGAFSAALLCSLTLYGIGRMHGRSAATLIVGGVALHFLFSSGVACLQFLAADDALKAIVFWIFGSLQGATWEKLWIVLGVGLTTLALLGPNAWRLTALRLGDRYAESLGIDVRRLRLLTLTLISILTATAVCFTGAIGFIGLIAPHLARTLIGEDQRYFVPFSALCGALVVSLAAVLCKMLVPGTVLPIGIATAAIGAPCFAGIALFSRRVHW